MADDRPKTEPQADGGLPPTPPADVEWRLSAMAMSAEGVPTALIARLEDGEVAHVALQTLPDAGDRPEPVALEGTGPAEVLWPVEAGWLIPSAAALLRVDAAGQLQKRWPVPAGGADRLALDDKGRVIHARDRTVRWWQKGRVVRQVEVQGGSGPIRAVVALPDGRAAVALSQWPGMLWLVVEGQGR